VSITILSEPTPPRRRRPHLVQDRGTRRRPRQDQEALSRSACVNPHFIRGWAPAPVRARPARPRARPARP
jgi:hypothetical protein